MVDMDEPNAHMAINGRSTIISTLYTHLEPNPHILALWLEGADATGFVDEYSDIDICCSVKEGAIAEVAEQAQRALESLGTLDLVQPGHAEKDAQTIDFHVEGTSKYLIIDFNIYVSRGSEFVTEDEIEKPLILFDRGNIIRTVSPKERLTSLQRGKRLQELKGTVAQYARLEKYLRRGEFLEAFGYYHKWLLQPLIEVLRMRYTPLHPDYYIVHISRHLPSEVLKRLEELFKINSVAEIEAKSHEAKDFFEETAAELDLDS
jgi:hypothetical protein